MGGPSLWGTGFLPWGEALPNTAGKNTYVFDAVLSLLHGAVTSLWVYPALFACAMLDGVVPVFPAETLVVTAGLYAAQGRPSLPLVVLMAAAGATTGDHLAYLLGRAAGRRVRAWSARGRRRAAAFAWAERGLAVRGGMVLVAARYVAGGRNAATMAMGAVGYPLRSFSFFDVIGAGSWALVSALLGYVGGVAFEQQPVEGLLFGLSAAVVITVMVEAVRRARPHGRPAGTAPPTFADETPEADEAMQSETGQVPRQGAEPGLERSSSSEGQVA